MRYEYRQVPSDGRDGDSTMNPIELLYALGVLTLREAATRILSGDTTPDEICAGLPELGAEVGSLARAMLHGETITIGVGDSLPTPSRERLQEFAERF